VFKPKKYIFKYNNRGYDNELILPVTPSHFTITSGIKTEVVNLTEVGDLNIPGTESAETITLDNVVFPIQKYHYVVGPHNSNPYVFTDAFERWARSHLPVRFVVSDTSVNIRVYIESIQYGTREGNGTGDVYATITMRPWRELTVPQVSTVAASTGGNKPRTGDSSAQNAQTYKVVRGDTLWGICRKFYSQPALCWKLATYNSIKNANLIFPGQILKIPDKKELAS